MLSLGLNVVTMLLFSKCQYVLMHPFKFCSIYFSHYKSISCLEEVDFVRVISKSGNSLNAKIKENCLFSFAERYAEKQEFFNLAKNLREVVVIKKLSE